MYKLINPWKTEIAIGNFKDQFDLDALTLEIINNFNFESLDSDINDFNIFEQENLPIVSKFKHEIVEENFKRYFKDVWDYEFWKKHNFNIKGWLSYPRHGYSIGTHNHPNAQLGSSYYIQINSPDEGGDIHFYDPRTNFNRGLPTMENSRPFSPQSFKPQTGDFYVFPAALYHSVDHYFGNMRISLICDLFIED